MLGGIWTSHGSACVLPRSAAATVITVSAIIECCVGTDPSSDPGRTPYATVSPLPSPERGWAPPKRGDGRSIILFGPLNRPMLSATLMEHPGAFAEGESMKVPELQGATESTVADASGNASVPDPQISGIGARNVTADPVWYRAVVSILPHLCGSGGYQKSVYRSLARMGNGGRERARCRAYPGNEWSCLFVKPEHHSSNARPLRGIADGTGMLEHKGPTETAGAFRLRLQAIKL